MRDASGPVRGVRRDIEMSFERAGLRLTPQRFDVMEFLARRPIHATATDIFRAVNRRNPRASRATVYNSLRALVRAGLARGVTLEGKAARFDANIHRHHHFICDRCGKVEDIGWFDVSAQSREAALGLRKVREYQVVFHGVCEICGRAKAQMKQGEK